jgi:hypothetical protein
MQIKDEAYAEEPGHGEYDGGTPMRNFLGQPVPAYKAYHQKLKHYMAPFNNIDEIRLIMLRLDEWLNLNECVKQGVLSRYFPATKHHKLMKLGANFANLNKMFSMPSHKTEPIIRDYFGERIAMFFRWFTFYVRMLFPLGIVGALCALRRLDIIGLSFDQQRWIQVGFAFVLVLWSSIFNKLFINRSARAAQLYGQVDGEHGDDARLEALANTGYDESLDGTWTERFRRVGTRVFLVLFMIAFIISIGILEQTKKERREEGDETFTNLWGPLLTAVLIKGVGFIWGRIAPLLAHMQNHRTMSRYHKDLTFTLSIVKIFVALWPFFVPAFITKYTKVTCGDTLMHAASQVYSKSGWPDGVVMSCGTPIECAKVNVTASDLAWLDTTTMRGDQKCIFGCFPAYCETMDGTTRCATSCIKDLEQSLMIVYLFHVAITLTFTITPMILVGWEVKKELRKVSEEHSDSEDEAQDNEKYSLLQLQAKCEEIAPYEYYSWGGSRCEDFLELAISYILLVCFGIILPGMALIAFLCTMVEYRLIAYRMTMVTGRPIPLSASGIGEWQLIFEVLSVVSVVCNAALAVFCMNPMRSWDTRDEFLAFIVLEHAMLLLHYVVYLLIPDEPYDVRRIDDFNHTFVHTSLTKRPKLAVPPSEIDHTDVDVSVTEHMSAE